MGLQADRFVFSLWAVSKKTTIKTELLIYPVTIVAKKWDPGILDPSRFSGQIRKVEARLGKLAKIRKVETN